MPQNLLPTPLCQGLGAIFSYHRIAIDSKDLRHVASAIVPLNVRNVHASVKVQLRTGHSHLTDPIARSCTTSRLFAC
jgi:hypothetical protein